MLCNNVANGMVTESSGEDGVDEAVEVETGDVEDSQDDQGQKCEEKETMKTSENPDTNTASRSLWAPSVLYRPQKEMYYFVGYEISIYEGLDSYGGMIWPGAVALCKYLETPAGQQQINLLDKSALEIGAGTGLVSIVATLHGAKVTATDLPEILGTLRWNLARNTKWRCRHPAQVAALSWGQELEKNFPRSTHHYDYVLAADVVYHHDYLNELLVTMCHFCQPGTTLIWSNKIRYQSDLGFIERFENAFHTIVLEEKDGIRIYMATAREVKEHAGQTMPSEQVPEDSDQMMQMKLVQEDSGQQMEHEEEKDQNVEKEEDVCLMEDVMRDNKTQVLQKGQKQRCSVDHVEGNKQERNANRKYDDKVENTKTDAIVGHKQRECDFEKEGEKHQTEVRAPNILTSRKIHNTEDFIRTETSEQSVTPNKASHHTLLAEKNKVSHQLISHQWCEITSQESQKRNNNMIEMTPDVDSLDTKKTLKGKEDKSHNAVPENKQLKTNVSRMYGDCLVNHMPGREEYSAPEVNHEEDTDVSGECGEDEGSQKSEETASDNDLGSHGTAQQEEETERLKTSENHDLKPAYQNTWSPGVLYRPDKEFYNFAGYDICIHESLDSDSMISPVEVALCTYLETPAGRQQVNLLDKSVIEIGAGTGLVSTVVTLLGAKVTATDLPEILGTLRWNLARNTKWRCRHPAQVAALSWGQELEKNFPRSTHHYDYVLAADVVYQHDHLNELLVTMCHFCQPGTTLIWSNKIRYQSDLGFIERFKEAFHTTVLEEKDEIRIYMATARKVQKHSGQMMQSERVQEHSGQMMQIVEHDHSLQDEKDKTVKEEENVCSTEDISTHKIEAFQEGKERRCSDEEVEGRQQEIHEEKTYQRLNYMKHVKKENTSNGKEDGAKIENDQKYEKVDPSKLLISYCSDATGEKDLDRKPVILASSCPYDGATMLECNELLSLSDTETEIHHFLGYEIAVRSLPSWNRGKPGPATLALCKFLETQQMDLQGKSALELGAGTGMVSIVASLLGAWVTATEQQEKFEILAQNLLANTKGRSKYSPQAEVLQWGHNLARSFPLSIYQYDYILAADVVHDHSNINELLDTMCHFCQRDTTLLWAHEFRHRSDVTFKAQFKRALHTKLLVEVGDVKIYMGNSKRTRTPSNWSRSLY